MSKNDINILIGILENRMNSATGTMERFTIFQEIKSLKLQLDNMADTSPAFWINEEIAHTNII
jgi:hypothetical protein